MEIYNNLLVKLNNIEKIIKEKKYEEDNDKYLKQHINWQFEYLDLVDSLEIQKQELTENRNKIHFVTKTLCSQLKIK